jgi:hypothetical protein
MNYRHRSTSDSLLASDLKISPTNSVVELGGREGDRYKLPGPECPEGGPGVRKWARMSGRGPGCPEGGPGLRKGAWGPSMLHMFASLGSTIICRLYKLTLSDQTQVTVQLIVTVSKQRTFCCFVLYVNTNIVHSALYTVS